LSIEPITRRYRVYRANEDNGPVVTTGTKAKTSLRLSIQQQSCPETDNKESGGKESTVSLLSIDIGLPGPQLL